MDHFGDAKAAKARTKTGSVPVIDIGDELIVGFERARLERLLAKAAPPATPAL